MNGLSVFKISSSNFDKDDIYSFWFCIIWKFRNDYVFKDEIFSIDSKVFKVRKLLKECFLKN